jgi:hypothetical protein
VQFTASLAPVALIGLVLTFVLIALFHRGEFAGGARLVPATPPTRTHRVLMLRALIATAVLIALFFAGQPPAKAAIVIGGLLLLTRRVRSERVYAEIDWSLLLMFAGLFIIVAGAEHSLLSDGTITAVARLHLDRVPVAERGEGSSFEPGQQRAGCSDAPVGVGRKEVRLMVIGGHQVEQHNADTERLVARHALPELLEAGE